MTKHYGHHNHYSKLHIPDHWEHYWSKYPNGYTLLEALISWTSQVNDMILSQNHMSDDMVALDRNFRALEKELRASWNGYKDHTEKTYADFREEILTILNNWIASIEPTIQDTIVTSMSGWLEDGTLADIINNDVFDMKANQTDLDNVTSQLTHIESDRAISPDDFEGSDFEKVQGAINEAITSGKGIRFTRMYDITGNTLVIDKPDDRKSVLFIGQGGGLLKSDSGFMFNTPRSYIGDLNFINMRFDSVEGAGTILFNADKIIRVKSTASVYRNVDTIAKATNRYIQSFDFIGDSIVGGKGSVFETPATYGLVCLNILVEHREHFFTQTPNMDPASEYKRMFKAVFRDCMFEGLEGYAFFLRWTISVTIDGCYFEQNSNGNIIFTDDAYIEGFEVSNTRGYEKPDVTNRTAFIEWGGRIEHAMLTNNMIENTAVNDTTRVTRGRVISVNSTNIGIAKSDIDTKNIVAKSESTPPMTTAEGVNITHFGQMRRLQKSSSVTRINPEQYNIITITFNEDISNDDIISSQIYTGATTDTTQEVYITRWVRDPSNKKLLKFWVKNNSSTNADVTIVATILKFNITITG